MYHCKKSGWAYGFKEGIKLYLRNFFANYLVTENIAITNWMHVALKFKKQRIIFNPFPLKRFESPTEIVPPTYDFLYVGRMVSEKGVPTLLRALREAINLTGKAYKLLIIGDGDCMELYKSLAGDLNLNNHIKFAGKKTGQDLVDSIYLAPIAIVPSEWHEPMGGVALELLSAGRCMIVSEFGGLKECVGKAGLTFPNGDFIALAERMVKLERDPELRENLLSHRAEFLLQFNPEKLVKQYISMLKEYV